MTGLGQLADSPNAGVEKEAVKVEVLAGHAFGWIS